MLEVNELQRERDERRDEVEALERDYLAMMEPQIAQHKDDFEKISVPPCVGLRKSLGGAAGGGAGRSGANEGEAKGPGQGKNMGGGAHQAAAGVREAVLKRVRPLPAAAGVPARALWRDGPALVVCTRRPG